ncbi:MAG: hypothetical protein ACE366_02170 [Bradymonadia bacterium]
MDRSLLFERIFQQLEEEAYVTQAFTEHMPEGAREEASAILAAAEEGASIDALERRIAAAEAAGLFHRPRALSMLCVVSTSPRFKAFKAACRYAGELEYEALCLEHDDERRHTLAALARHRGAIAFLMERYEEALEQYSRSLELVRSAQALGNVLACLLRLGEEDEADALLTRIREAYPNPLVVQLETFIDQDNDLAVLRQRGSAF